jgi:hypothetical protein
MGRPVEVRGQLGPEAEKVEAKEPGIQDMPTAILRLEFVQNGIYNCVFSYLRPRTKLSHRHAIPRLFKRRVFGV